MNALPCMPRLFLAAVALATVLSAAPSAFADRRVLDVPKLASNSVAYQTWAGDRSSSIGTSAGPPGPKPNCKCNVPGTGEENPAGWLLGLVVGAAVWRWRRTKA